MKQHWSSKSGIYSISSFCRVKGYIEKATKRGQSIVCQSIYPRARVRRPGGLFSFRVLQGRKEKGAFMKKNINWGSFFLSLFKGQASVAARLFSSSATKEKFRGFLMRATTNFPPLSPSFQNFPQLFSLLGHAAISDRVRR